MQEKEVRECGAGDEDLQQRLRPGLWTWMAVRGAAGSSARSWPVVLFALAGREQEREEEEKEKKEEDGLVVSMMASTRSSSMLCLSWSRADVQGFHAISVIFLPVEQRNVEASLEVLTK